MLKYKNSPVPGLVVSIDDIDAQIRRGDSVTAAEANAYTEFWIKMERSNAAFQLDELAKQLREKP